MLTRRWFLLGTTASIAVTVAPNVHTWTASKTYEYNALVAYCEADVQLTLQLYRCVGSYTGG